VKNCVWVQPKLESIARVRVCRAPVVAVEKH
jgi:hypothetical protein